jgi:hypothetical protein
LGLDFRFQSVYLGRNKMTSDFNSERFIRRYSAAHKAGEPERPIDSRVFCVPDAKPILKNGSLVWPRKYRLRPSSVPDDLLERFARLSRAQRESSVLAFAGDYGPLGICRHGLPAAHPILSPRGLFSNWEIASHQDLRHLRERLSGGGSARVAVTRDDLVCLPLSNEPIAMWRRFSGRVAGLLQAAEAVWRGESPTAEIWVAAEGVDWTQVPDIELQWLDEPWVRLAENLNWWLDMTQVAPVMTPGKRGMDLHYCGRDHGLLWKVAIWLIFATNRFEGLYTCSGCGQVFPVRRALRAGRAIGRGFATRNYCADCQRKGQPHRDAARDYYARIKIKQNKNGK